MWNEQKFNKAVEKLPKLYSTENINTKEKIVRMHLFIGGSDWYIIEGDVKEGVLFGFACLNGDWQNAEWGYVSIEELKSLKIPYMMRGKRIFQEIDFDLYWSPIAFAKIDSIQKNVYGLGLEDECKAEV